MQLLSLNDAYKIQNRLWKNSEHVCAWKLGGTNSLTRDLFAINEPYFGFLTSQNLLQSGPKVVEHLDQFELEICFQTPSSFDHNIDYSLEEIMAWKRFLCLEFPFSKIADIPAKGVSHLVADNCAAGQLFVSQIEIASVTPPDYELYVRGERVVDRLTLTRSTFSIINQFLEIARFHEFKVLGGQYLALGGISMIQKLHAEDSVQVYCDDRLVLDYVQ
jgi:hypothetical protein